MNLNKQQLIEQARNRYRVDQFNHNNFNASKTKIGPCFQSYGKWTGASWSPTYPINDDYLKKFSLLGEKYKNLSYTFLDIPKIELTDLEEFKHIWEKEKIEIRRLLPSEDEPWDAQNHPLGEQSSWNRVEFNGLHIHSNATLDFNIHDLYRNGKLDQPQYSTETGFRQGRVAQGTFTKKLFKNRFFSDIIVQIMDTFPIAVLNTIMIVEPIKEILPHREQTWAWQCPTEFRVTLHDENTKPTMYVTHIETGQTNYITAPESSNSFCWSNGTHLYGIDYDNKPQYHLIVSAIWCPEKMDKLLEQSIGKHGILLETH